MNRTTGRSEVGVVIVGMGIVFVGAWFFLRNTLGLDIGEPDWDSLWPILVIAIGVLILARVARQPPVAR